MNPEIDEYIQIVGSFKTISFNSTLQGKNIYLIGSFIAIKKEDLLGWDPARKEAV